MYSEESRQKMSESALARAEREKHTNVRSESSKKGWAVPGVREHHSAIRKGKRLRAPKLSDDKVVEIRSTWADKKTKFDNSTRTINDERRTKNKSHKLTNGAREFAKAYADIYDVSVPTIYNIITNRCRTKIIPSI